MTMQLTVRKRPLWMSILIITACLLFLLAAAVTWIWTIWIAHTPSAQTDIFAALFTALGVILAFLQFSPLLIPSSQPISYSVSRVDKLSRDNLKMGTNDAANFPYVTAPVQQAYDLAIQTLRKAGTQGKGAMCVMLVLGAANTGKTRLIVEGLMHILPRWLILRISSLSSTEKIEIPNRCNLVIFIDDLHQYASAPGAETDTPWRRRNVEAEELQALLDAARSVAKRVVVVAAARIEHRGPVQADFGWLFDELEVIKLPRFSPNVQDTEAMRIIEQFRKQAGVKQAVVHEEDWDGTPGSLVLGLSKKRGQYDSDLSGAARTVLCAMKLLTYAGTNDHTETRIQQVCEGVFQESIFREQIRAWRNVEDELVRMQFVTVNFRGMEGKVSLLILSKSYFEKVVHDYPENEEYSVLLRDLLQLQQVFVRQKDVSGLFTLGDAFSNYKEYERALAAYDQALALDSTNAQAWDRRGVILYSLGRYADEVASYEHALSLNPNMIDTWCDKGLALDDLRRHDEALEAYKQALALDPTYARAWSLKGATLVQTGDYEGALEAYTSALQHDPRDVNSWLNKARVLTVLQRYEEALEAFERVLAVNPEQAEAWKMKGLVLLDLNREQEALEASERSLALDAESADAWLLACLVHLRLAQYQKACDAADRLLKIEPDSELGWYFRGIALFNLQQYETALAAGERTLAINPDNPAAWMLKSEAFLKLKRYDDAQAAVEKAQAINPNVVIAAARRAPRAVLEQSLTDLVTGEEGTYNPRVWFIKGNLLCALMRYDEALAAFARALQLNPNFVQAWNAQGVALIKLGRYADASKALEQALALEPDFVLALANMGELLIIEKRYEEAVTMLDWALQGDPDLALVWIDKGVALASTKRYEEALQAYDRALALDPDNGSIWLYKYSALLMLGRYAEASKALEHFGVSEPDAPLQLAIHTLTTNLRTDDPALVALESALETPGDANAWLIKAILLFGRKRFEEALAAAEQALKMDPGLVLAWRIKGNTLLLLQKPEQALVAFEQAVTLAPGDSLAWGNKGEALLLLKRYREAIDAFNRARDLNPQLASAQIIQFMMGKVLLGLKRYEEALEAFNRALASGQQNILEGELWYLEGQALAHLKRRAEAMQAYNRALAPGQAKRWRNWWIVVQLWVWKRTGAVKGKNEKS